MEPDKYEQYEGISFKSLFVPLTTLKAIIFIVIIGLIVFVNMLFNGFVWDDKSYIIQNPEMRNLSLESLFGPNMFNSIGQYRPIPAFYFAGLYSLFGDKQFFYHFLQLLLHIINAILVYKLFTKFFTKGISYISAIIFLIHPLQVESVSFIAASISPIFFFFGISALLLSMKEVHTKKEVFLIFFFLLLSILTKETGLLFLIIILIYKIIFHKKSLLLYLSTGFFTVFTYLMIRFFVGSVEFHRLLLIPIARLSLPERLLNIPAILYYYISNLFLPVNLSHNQLWVISKIDFNNFYFPLIIDLLFFFFIALGGFCIFKKGKQIFKTYLFFLSWFILGLGMHLQIIPLDQTVADRWVYFPLVGIIGVLASVAMTYKGFIQKYLQVSLIIIIGVTMALSIRTMIRNADWTNGITLYTHDMKVSNNFDIEDNLGVEYFEKANYKQAITHFKNSYELFPYEVNAYNIALAYVRQGDYENAEVYFGKSLQEKNYAETSHSHEQGNYEIYAILLLQLKKYEKANVIIREGIKDYSNASHLRMLLAYTNYQTGDKKEALIDAQKAIKLDPNNQQAHLMYDHIQQSKPILLNPIK